MLRDSTKVSTNFERDSAKSWEKQICGDRRAGLRAFRVEKYIPRAWFDSRKLRQGLARPVSGNPAWLLRRPVAQHWLTTLAPSPI
jgi:hypothetical protein